MAIKLTGIHLGYMGMDKELLAFPNPELVLHADKQQGQKQSHGVFSRVEGAKGPQGAATAAHYRQRRGAPPAQGHPWAVSQAACTDWAPRW